MVEQQSLDDLSAEQLRELASRLLVEVRHKQALIDKLTHENALLKRLKFAAQSERYDAEQRSLLEDALDADQQAVSDEIDQLDSEARPHQKQQPKRQPLPAHLPRREIRHEPDFTICHCGCQMKRIGEDVAEKLDYVPGLFTVERHVRGKWACVKCQTLVQAPVAAHIIDKGIPTAGLLAQVLVAKFADHLPLYRQEAIADDGRLPVDNNHIENQIRPVAIGRNNWLFAGSLRAGQRAAAAMSLIQSAKLNGHDPYVYLKDVLTRLPEHRMNRIEELLPQRWRPLAVGHADQDGCFEAT